MKRNILIENILKVFISILLEHYLLMDNIKKFNRYIVDIFDGVNTIADIECIYRLGLCLTHH